MQPHSEVIKNEKLVLKAAQSVWAINKYFVLACSQQQYRKVRELLKPQTQDLPAAYAILKEVNTTFKDVPTATLSQITNALYHMAGYFKKHLQDTERQHVHNLIEKDTYLALELLEMYSSLYKVHYLLDSNIWPSKRSYPFNQLPSSFMTKKVSDNISHFYWQGDYIIGT